MTENGKIPPVDRLLKENNKDSVIESVVIVSVITLGFVGPLVIYTCKWFVPPIVVAVLLGAAISALVYKFLGGILPKDATFTFGALKLGGSIAALTGCAFFINNSLEKQTVDMDKLFTPHHSEWVVIEKSTSAPLRVKVKDIGELPKVPDDEFANNKLSIRKENDVMVVLNKDKQFCFGTLDANDLKAMFCVHVNDKLDKFVITDRLATEKKVELDPIPFTMETGKYDKDYSRYFLLDRSGSEVYNGSIYRRQAEIVQVSGRYYLVAVVEVDHNPKEGEPYAKFAIGEIRPEVENIGNN